MIPRIISAMLCSLPLIAAAGDNLELNGLQPGISKSAIHQRMPALQCVPDRAVSAYSACNYVRTNPHQDDVNALDSLGGALVESWELRFDDDVLGRILVSFHSTAFDRVVSNLRTNFGEPTGKSTEALYTPAGTRFISRKFTWQRNGQMMVATEFDGRINSSTVTLASNAHLNRTRS
jgi:hypothetical protein